MERRTKHRAPRKPLELNRLTLRALTGADVITTHPESWGISECGISNCCPSGHPTKVPP